MTTGAQAWEPVSTSEAGFSLIEVVVAVLILTVGLLGLAATTGFVLRQTSLADLTTERSVAVQSVVERLRARDLADVTDGSAVLGNFEVSWTVEDHSHWKTIDVVSVGPGLVRIDGGAPALGNGVADAFTFRMIELRP